MNVHQFLPMLSAAIIADPTLSRGGAIDLLQIEAPDLTNTEGGEWIDALAVEYESLGIINNATWVSFRNEIANEGDTVANDLFDALQTRIDVLPETKIVNRALRRQGWILEQATIPAHTATVKALRNATSDKLLKTAYNSAIATLEERDLQLTDKLS